MLVIPALEVEGGRSRVAFWPGASAAAGVPTDRPGLIAERLVNQGAGLLHLVDFDGAKAGRPANLEAIGEIASRVAVPLQVAGGLEGGDHIRLAFAAGATRAVVSMAVADRPELLAECVAVAGDWLAIGLDPRPDRLAAFPWRRPVPPTLAALVDELEAQGVGRFVLSHGGARPDVELLASLARGGTRGGREILVAGGVGDLATIGRLRDAGVAGLILGEPLLSGTLPFAEARAAAT
ncbi:MAG TPA: HisA/HisF-related TIM barrel protein [Candidatus Limnocylindrales bacterium]